MCNAHVFITHTHTRNTTHLNAREWERHLVRMRLLTQLNKV